LSPQILSYKYKNERSVAFKIRQNPFSTGDPPRTPLGELTSLPRPPSRLKRGHPSHTLRHSAPIHLRPSPCARIPARSTPMIAIFAEVTMITTSALWQTPARQREAYIQSGAQQERSSQRTACRLYFGENWHTPQRGLSDS